MRRGRIEALPWTLRQEVHVRVSLQDDAVIPGAQHVRPAGLLDTTGAPLLIDAVFGQITAAKPSLLMDLEAVEWVSSAGVGALVKLLARTQALQGKFALCNCGPRVLTVLRICGLESALVVCKSLDEAREKLRGA